MGDVVIGITLLQEAGLVPEFIPSPAQVTVFDERTLWMQSFALAAELEPRG